KVRTIDNALKRDFIKFDRLQFEGVNYASNPQSLHIKAIQARGPYARVIVESDRTVNVQKVLSGPNGAKAPAASDTENGSTATDTEPVPVATAESVAAAQPPAPPAAAPPPPAPAATKSGKSARKHGKAAPAQQSVAGAMAIAIDAINVQDGSANYAD